MLGSSIGIAIAVFWGSMGMSPLWQCARCGECGSCALRGVRCGECGSCALRAAGSAGHANIFSRTDVHVSHHAFVREEQRAGNLPHVQLPVVQPHDIAPAHPSEGEATSWNAPPQNNPTANLRVTSGLAKPAPPTDIGGRIYWGGTPCSQDATSPAKFWK